MRALLLLPALWLCLGASGQDGFLPMIQADRTWCGVEGGWVPTPLTYWVDSDTVVADGSLWSKLVVQHEGNANEGMAGWFHEDVVTGEVWMRWDLDLDPGTLWFDFGMEPGDVMSAPNCDWADITCTAVEPFTWTDGTVSRRLTLQLLPDNTEFVEYWIEGIGSENGPMGPAAYLCIADWDPHAACFVDGGVVRHDFEMDTTWLPAHAGCTGAAASVSLDLPPAGALMARDGHLHWTGEPLRGHIVLYDLMGRRVETLRGDGPWPTPAAGILIAVLPGGGRLKIQTD